MRSKECHPSLHTVAPFKIQTTKYITRVLKVRRTTGKSTIKLLEQLEASQIKTV